TPGSSCGSTRRPTSCRTSSSSGRGRSTCRRSLTGSRRCSRSTAPTTALKPEERPMNLAEALLAKLAKWRPDSGRQTLDVVPPDSGWAVAVDAGQVEFLGGRFWEVALRPLQPAPVADLQARAEQMAGRVTGLLEPLRLVEVDAGRGEAQLRS